MEKNTTNITLKVTKYNITNSETLCIHCQGWGKVALSKNNPNIFVNCPTCNGSLLISSNKVAKILGSS